MSKQAYKIPADLNASYGDMEIALQSKDGLGAKPLPIKFILTWLGSIVVLFYVCTQSFISAGSFWQIGLFVLLWILLTALLARFDGTKRMQAELIPTLFNYLPKSNRYVVTRTTSKANGFYQIAPFSSIDKETGLITFADGTYAYLYRVVGSASILLFDKDKDAILTRVDAFFQKSGTDYESVMITTKSAQKVYRQLASLKRRYDALTVDDPDLNACAEEQFQALKNKVGSEFRSIHQYWMLKADNKEALRRAKSILQAETENSSLMMKQCHALSYEDMTEVFSLIYGGKRGIVR